MRNVKGLAGLAILAGLVFPVLMALTPAMAATSSGSFCLQAGSGDECMTTHGAGSAVTLQSSGYTEFYTTTTSNGDLKFHVNNSSHCLQVNGSIDVLVEDCAAGNGLQEWSEHSGCQYSPFENSESLESANLDLAEPFVGDNVNYFFNWTCF